jgi:hypothetical protein
MTAIFGSAAGDMRPTSAGAVKFERDDPRYVAWYVTTSVKWNGPSGIEGGSMMRRVSLSGGRTATATLP